MGEKVIKKGLPSPELRRTLSEALLCRVFQHLKGAGAMMFQGLIFFKSYKGIIQTRIKVLL